MAEAYMLLKAHYGQATVDRLCIHNPRVAFLGEPIRPQPEPIGLIEEFESPNAICLTGFSVADSKSAGPRGYGVSPPPGTTSFLDLLNHLS